MAPPVLVSTQLIAVCLHHRSIQSVLQEASRADYTMVGDADTTELSNTPHGVLSKVNAWKIMLLILYNVQKMEKFPTLIFQSSLKHNYEMEKNVMIFSGIILSEWLNHIIRYFYHQCLDVTWTKNYAELKTHKFNEGTQERYSYLPIFPPILLWKHNDTMVIIMMS